MKHIIFISDLDGTLLVSNKKVCKTSMEVIRNAKEQLTFCVATGRHIEEVTTTLALHKDAKFIITSNGNEIYEVGPNEALTKIYAGSTITQEIARQATHLAQKYNVYRIAGTSNRYLCENKDSILYLTEKWFGMHHEKIASIESYINQGEENVLKIIFIARPSVIKKLYNELHDALGMVADIAFSSTMSIEINMKGVTKGAAIRFLKQYIQADEQTIFACVGDNGNDISMIDSCHYSFAMRGGMAELKAMVTEVVPTVGHAVSRVLVLREK